MFGKEKNVAVNDALGATHGLINNPPLTNELSIFKQSREKGNLCWGLSVRKRPYTGDSTAENTMLCVVLIKMKMSKGAVGFQFDCWCFHVNQIYTHVALLPRAVLQRTTLSWLIICPSTLRIQRHSILSLSIIAISA